MLNKASADELLEAARQQGWTPYTEVKWQHGVRQNPLYGKYANATALQQFRAVQSTLAKALWAEHGPSKIVAGFYTFLEEPQVLLPLPFRCPTTAVPRS